MTTTDLNEVIDGLGWGKFQIVNFMMIGCLLMVDGMQMVLGSAVAGSLVAEYHADIIYKGLLTSVVFCGLFVGGLLTGPIGDGYGRRFACIIAYVLFMVFGLGCAASSNMAMQMCTRFLMGTGAGIGVPAVVTLLTESSPTSHRSQILNASGFFFTAGEIWACIGLMIFLPTLEGQKWREPCLWGVLPAFVMFPFAFIFLKESPRWLFMKGHTQKLNELLSDAAIQNDKPNLDTHISVTQSSNDNEQELSAVDSFAKLFSTDLWLTTCIGSYLCFLCNFMFFGQSYALAQEFQGEKGWINPAGQLLVSCAFEIPSIFIVMAAVQVEWLGHRDTISIFSLSSCVLSCLLITMDYDIKWIADPAAYLMKLSSSSLFLITYVYIPEAYPQRLRQTGVGFCISAGRLGSILAPIIFEGLDALFGYGTHIPYLLLNAVMCILGAWMAQELRVETKGMRLAEESQQEIEEEMSKATSRWSKRSTDPEREHLKSK